MSILWLFRIMAKYIMNHIKIYFYKLLTFIMYSVQTKSYIKNINRKLKNNNLIDTDIIHNNILNYKLPITIIYDFHR